MPMTVLVTRNVPDRYRGFLASCMLEVAPGVYTGPRMNASVRERVWRVCVEWSVALPKDGGVVMLWHDRNAPTGQSIRTLGSPPKEVLDHEGCLLTMRPLRRRDSTAL